MERPLVGEFMSKVFDAENVVEGINDVYASQRDLLIGKPLDIGQLYYKRLRDVCMMHATKVTDYEVVWDHNRSMLLGMIEVDGEHETHCALSELAAMARRERYALIDHCIREMFCNVGIEI